jgi:sulfur carrier protein
MIDVVVNGQSMQINKDITIQKLIENLQIQDKVMAAAINMEVVKKDAWEVTQIKENDKIEFLQFVGGG